MARSITLSNDEELNDMAESLGFNPDEGEATAEGQKREHPVQIHGPGDIMKAMRIVAGMRKEIENEKSAMDEEINHIKDFRQQRIERKQDALSYLTQPLEHYIAEWGENYNGPAGHAGYHTVTTTDWKATEDEILEYALAHGLKVKMTLKCELTPYILTQIRELLKSQGVEQDDYSMDLMPYKSAIKQNMKERGLHKAAYSESGEQVGANPLYEQVKRQDFRIKPE